MTEIRQDYGRNLDRNVARVALCETRGVNCGSARVWYVRRSPTLRTSGSIYSTPSRKVALNCSRHRILTRSSQSVIQVLPRAPNRSGLAPRRHVEHS